MTHLWFNCWRWHHRNQIRISFFAMALGLFYTWMLLYSYLMLAILRQGHKHPKKLFLQNFLFVSGVDCQITSWIKIAFLHSTEINTFNICIFNTDSRDFILSWNTSHSGKQKNSKHKVTPHIRGNTFMASLQFVYNYILWECFFLTPRHIQNNRVL